MTIQKHLGFDLALDSGGLNVIRNDVDYAIAVVRSSHAAFLIAQDTRWCIAEGDWFQKYMTHGDLIYIEQRPLGRRWLLHSWTCEFRNARNRRAHGPTFATHHRGAVADLLVVAGQYFRLPFFFGVVPTNTCIEHSLNLAFTPVDRLPDGLRVRDDLDIWCTHLQTLPKGLVVGGNLTIAPSLEIPRDAVVAGAICRTPPALRARVTAPSLRSLNP
jgi:hypothetical protein